MTHLYKKFRFTLIVLVITLGVFLCLEGGTRWYLRDASRGILVNRPILSLYGDMERPEDVFASLNQDCLQWSPYEHWVTRPNLSTRIFRTNALGFRGAETIAQKPAGRFRIVVLGGSAAWGFGCTADEHTVPGRLETILRTHYPDRDIEVINAGQAGYVSSQELTYFHRVVAPLKPDLVLLFDGYNDIWADLTNTAPNWPQNAALLQSRYDASLRSFRLRQDLMDLLRRSRFLDLTSRNILAWLRKSQAAPAAPVIEPAVTAGNYIRNVQAIERLAAPAPVWVALQPVLAYTRKPLTLEEERQLAAKEQVIPEYIERVQAAYRAIIERVQKAGLPMIPLEDALGSEPRLMFADDIHFGDEAANHIASRIALYWLSAGAIPSRLPDDGNIP